MATIGWQDIAFRALSLYDGTNDGITMEDCIVCIIGQGIRCDGHGVS